MEPCGKKTDNTILDMPIEPGGSDTGITWRIFQKETGMPVPRTKDGKPDTGEAFRICAASQNTGDAMRHIMERIMDNDVMEGRKTVSGKKLITKWNAQFSDAEKKNAEKIPSGNDKYITGDTDTYKDFFEVLFTRNKNGLLEQRTVLAPHHVLAVIPSEDVQKISREKNINLKKSRTNFTPFWNYLADHPELCQGLSWRDKICLKNGWGVYDCTIHHSETGEFWIVPKEEHDTIRHSGGIAAGSFE